VSGKYLKRNIASGGKISDGSDAQPKKYVTTPDYPVLP
jgi:hypothetical protein